MSHQSWIASWKAKKAGSSIICRGYLRGHLLRHMDWGLLGYSSHCIRVILIPSICIDNVEVIIIIIIAMACHIGLYLELTFNEGSQLSSATTWRGALASRLGQLERLPWQLHTFYSRPIASWCGVHRITLYLSWALTAYVNALNIHAISTQDPAQKQKFRGRGWGKGEGRGGTLAPVRWSKNPRRGDFAP